MGGTATGDGATEVGDIIGSGGISSPPLALVTAICSGLPGPQVNEKGSLRGQDVNSESRKKSRPEAAFSLQ